MRGESVRNVLFLSRDVGGALLAQSLLWEMDARGFLPHAAATHPFAQPDLAVRYLLRSMGGGTCIESGKCWMEFASPDATRFDFIVTLSCESAELYGAVSSRRWLPILPGGGAFLGGAPEMMDGAMLSFPGNPVWLDWSREMDMISSEVVSGGVRTLPESLGKRVKQGRRLHALLQELVRMPTSRERPTVPTHPVAALACSA